MPLKDKDRRNEYQRILMRKRRAKEREKRLEEAVARGDINAVSLERRRSNRTSWQEWKLSHKNGTFQEFMQEVRARQLNLASEESFFEREQSEEDNPDSVPTLGPDCRTFRDMRQGIIPRDPFFIQNHCSCPLCTRWMHIWKKSRPQGWRLWA
jgi:hypothetical protein